eukprot:1159943-Pelagomonas_calceolata.AAC.5
MNENTKQDTHPQPNPFGVKAVREGRSRGCGKAACLCTRERTTASRILRAWAPVLSSPHMSHTAKNSTSCICPKTTQAPLAMWHTASPRW